MKLKYLLGITLLTGIRAFADPFMPVSSSICSAPGYADVVGTSSCVFGATHASSGVSLQLASNAADYSVISGSAEAYANILPGGSRTTTTLDQTLTTSGPMRQGFIQAVLTGSGGYSGDGAFASTFVKLPLNNASLQYVGCSASSDGCTSTEQALAHFNPLPFTLGQDFLLSYSSSAYASAKALEGSSSGANMTLSFRFTELDGTPVAVMSAAPEPASWSLLGLSLGGVAVLRKRRQAC